jgi:streptomycin 6-kinase
MGRPSQLAWAMAEWGCTPDGPESVGYASRVQPVRTRDGRPAVLKLGPPEELEALDWFAGRGAVAVLERGPGVALMERVLPGTHLREIPDDEAATAAAAGVMRALWRPAPAEHAFATVSEWGAALSGRPADVFGELCASMGEEVVLHGDLHHDNVLWSDDRGWLAIDPKGVVGEREYEAGALLRNPVPVLIEPRTLARRADQLAEGLGLDGARIRAWAWAQAHLAAVWSVEMGEDPRYFLAMAERLSRI